MADEHALIAESVAARLYGTVGAEELFIDPETAYESQVEPWRDDPLTPGKRVEIEEWDVHPTRYHMPTADALLDWIAEWTVENGEVGEGFEIDSATGAADVKAAAETLLDLMASKVTYTMARTHLRSLWVTWTDDGEPLLDGEPMYVKAAHIDGCQLPDDDAAGSKLGGAE